MAVKGQYLKVIIHLFVKSNSYIHCTDSQMWSIFFLCSQSNTWYLDPEYMEFVELLAKPVENLPSAEIQLERREAERAGQ